MRANIFTCLCLMILAAWTHAEDASKKLVISKDEQAIIDETNSERKKAGLPALKPNAQLFAAARAHSADMAKENSMEHRLHDKGPAERIDATGYKAMSGRENIAFKYARKEVVDGWMHSEEHKHNILADDVGEIGVGIVNDADGQPYYTQLFALSEKNAIQVKVSIRNVARKELTLELGDGAPSTLKPGASGSFTLVAALNTPSITVQFDDLKKTVKVKAGSNVTVDLKNGEILVQGDVR